jgi:hypothetical protein
MNVIRHCDVYGTQQNVTYGGIRVQCEVTTVDISVDIYINAT